MIYLVQFQVKLGNWPIWFLCLLFFSSFLFFVIFLFFVLSFPNCSFYLFSSFLTSYIPYNYYCFIRRLDGNKFFGSLPTELGNLDLYEM